MKEESVETENEKLGRRYMVGCGVSCHSCVCVLGGERPSMGLFVGGSTMVLWWMSWSMNVGGERKRVEKIESSKFSRILLIRSQREDKRKSPSFKEMVTYVVTY